MLAPPEYSLEPSCERTSFRVRLLLRLVLTLQLDVLKVDLFVFALRDGGPKRNGLLRIFDDLGFVFRESHGRSRGLDLCVARACLTFCSSCSQLFVNNVAKLHMLVGPELFLS